MTELCPLLHDVERRDGRWLNGRMVEIQLIAPGSACLPNNQILRTWADPA